jgi:hypothetical protein
MYPPPTQDEALDTGALRTARERFRDAFELPSTPPQSPALVSQGTPMSMPRGGVPF